ncbi:predicted protein [Uncinocarpus reesii 1704]|uniref:Uncharacterized protein n=1 Tax=Uncinocarpus reesii (strain UAMH 1704) TaxID=336963 RepID=C4JPT3_UNCRE|nr:uncharacterized protein UREG_04576 [Uncinocarpus reesii 1704]EEP79730.1 predicted protein [Uncinocarpus reesii 1704]
MSCLPLIRCSATAVTPMERQGTPGRHALDSHLHRHPSQAKHPTTQPLPARGRMGSGQRNSSPTNSANNASVAATQHMRLFRWLNKIEFSGDPGFSTSESHLELWAFIVSPLPHAPSSSSL